MIKIPDLDDLDQYNNNRKVLQNNLSADSHTDPIPNLVYAPFRKQYTTYQNGSNNTFDFNSSNINDLETLNSEHIQDDHINNANESDAEYTQMREDVIDHPHLNRGLFATNSSASLIISGKNISPQIVQQDHHQHTDFVLSDPPKQLFSTGYKYPDAQGAVDYDQSIEFSSPTMSHNQVTPQIPQGQTPNPITPMIPLNNDPTNRMTITSSTLTPNADTAKLTLSNGREFSSIRKGLATESKTPAEYTLHILFTQFVRHAERKLSLCLNYPLENEPPIVDLLAEGIDSNFDKIIASLGYIARKKPKPVIDSVMFWRKSKSELAAYAASEVENKISMAREQLKKSSNNFSPAPASTSTNPVGTLMRSKSLSRLSNHKRNKSSSSSNNQSSINSDIEYSKKHLALEEEIQTARQTAIQADRKSLASIFILCRVLIEVVKQTSPEIIGADLGDKLEEIVFTQMKTTDPLAINGSLIRYANWSLFAELLGYMSTQRFLSVSDRFIADLEKVPKNFCKDDEPRLQLLIHGMRYLHLSNFPHDKFEDSADFLQSIGKFFDFTNNEANELAYSEVLSDLLLPLANVLSAEVNHPTWVEAIEKIYKKAIHLLLRQKSWDSSITLVTTILSVAPKSLFLANWYEIIESNSYKLKPKMANEDKITYITCVSRLVWVFLYRCTESLNNTVRCLDNLFALLFFSGNSTAKKNWITADLPLVQSLVQLLRAVGFLHLNYTLDNILIRLLKNSFNGTSLENISQEKIIVIVRSYVAILNDYESKKGPPFPTDETVSSKLNTQKYKHTGNEIFARDSTNAASHDEICKSLSSMLQLLDTSHGAQISIQEKVVSTPLSSSYYKSNSPFSAFHFGSDISYQIAKNLNIELFATVIEASPWCLTSSSIMPFRQLVEILARNSVHHDFRVATAAVNALKLLASNKNPNALITAFSRTAFQFTDKPSSNYNFNYLASDKFPRLLKIYVDLLKCWLTSFNGDEAEDNDEEIAKSGALRDLYEINKMQKAKTPEKQASDELEWKNMITVIEEVEGNGLFFLSSQDFKIRHLGLKILRIIEQFDQAIYDMTSSLTIKNSHTRSSSKFAADIGTRLIHILEDVDFFELITPYKQELSMAERSRLTKLKKRKDILIKLAESDYGIDSALWFRIFPKLLIIFFERCPMPVALCRSIVCVRLVQMHELVFEFSETPRNATSSLLNKSAQEMPPELLVEQWKLYLIFACSSLTSTNEQKISFPSQPTHGRKKSLQMFIQHQKITSAKSVFRMVLPLLKSQQTMVRDSIVTGLSCININIFKTLLENIQPVVNEWEIDHKKRSLADDRLKVETAHILANVTTKFISDSLIYRDERIVSILVSIIKNVKTFLSNSLIQLDFEFQKLRRYFCILLKNVFLGLQRVSKPDKWLPFEARIGCFTLLKEWCGFGEYAQVSHERYNHMMKKTSINKESASMIALIEIERNALEFESISCMAALCSGPIMQEIEENEKTAVISFDIPSLMNWVAALFTSKNTKVHTVGKLALGNILKLNPSSREILSEVIKQCYYSHEDQNTTESYFIVFAETYMEVEKFDCAPHEPLALSLFLLASDNFDIRSIAVKLLAFTEKRFFQASTTEKFSESVCSKTKVIYKRALLNVSTHLAGLYPQEKFNIISTLTMYFHIVGPNSKRDMLVTLLPWIQSVDLKLVEDIADLKDDSSLITNKDNKEPSRGQFEINSVMVLNNLFEITIKSGTTVQNEVEALWVALGNKLDGTNTEKILHYIISNGAERRNPVFVEHARQVVDWISLSQPDSSIINILVDNLQPKSMVPPHFKSVNMIYNSNNHNLPYVANLWKTLSHSGKEGVLSLGQLSMIFLVDLFTVSNDVMKLKLPLLLHISFVLLDHYFSIVQNQAIELLIHLIHELAPMEPKSRETIEMLRKNDNSTSLWVYDDLNNDKNGGRTPKNMDMLVRNVLEIFSVQFPSLQKEWSRVSLTWATTCAVRHIACRSFQIFRSLLSFLDQPMLRDMLHRLSNTIADETNDIQGFAMQILMTLNAITAELDSEKLIDFPQLFWCSVACLSTIHEQEFIEVLSTLSKFVSKIDLDSPETVSCLISTFPPKWEGKFEGLQQIVMIGLRSSNSWEASLKFLDRLNKLKDSAIIGSGDSRLLMALLANMPRFLHAFDQKSVSSDVLEAAKNLIEMAKAYDKPSLARIITSFSKSSFRAKKDFLKEVVRSTTQYFFPEFDAQTLVFLLGILSNKIGWVKIETMSYLREIFPSVDLRREEFVGVGADLISPLLRLLLTDYAETALEVLDETVIISGSQLDKDILRMSLGNRAIRKEYEKTATLFGIPDESGWAIPMPAVTAATTRNNVHAVFSTCILPSATEAENEESVNAEEIQFHMEDYSYNPNAEYGDSVSMSAEEPDASLNSMWATLDEMDSFFTGQLGIGSTNNTFGNVGNLNQLRNAHHHTESVDTKYSNISSGDPIIPIDSAPQVYDRNVSVILNRSLARTQSNTSFKTSLADSFNNTGNDYSSMQPTRRISYMPFRNHKLSTKYSTLSMPAESDVSLTNESPSARSPSPIGSPTLSNFTATTIGINGSVNNVTPSPITRSPPTTAHDSSFRFDTLLHGNSKKKNKKTGRFSSVNSSSPGISVPESPSAVTHRNNKPTMTPPNSASSNNNSVAVNGKAKDKLKRNSQKFKSQSSYQGLS